MPMTHSKGPWEADQGGIWDADGKDVATCGELAQWSGDCFHPFDNANANARLIAAAPDLLSACEAVAASGMRNAAYDACVAAINKATKA